MARQHPDAELALAEAREICAVAAPPFGEEDRAEFVAHRLAALGVAVRRDELGNVIATLPGAAEPPVAFVAHLDTVFPASADLTLREERGRLLAPGIGDNSLGVAGLLHLARHLRGRPLDRSVLLVASVGEEGLGDLRGAKALVKAEPLHAFVAIEGAGLDAITVAAVGSLRLRVRITGPGGHSWGDRDRPSAVHALIEGLSGLSARLARPDLAFNVGTMSGGSAINAVAATATADLDLRAQDDARLQAAAAEVERALTAATAAEGLELELERIGHRPGGSLEPGHPLLDAARRARGTAGLPPAEEDASSTDANAAHGAGIPAITVGITTGGGMHTTGEWIDTPPVDAGLRALAILAAELAGPG